MSTPLLEMRDVQVSRAGVPVLTVPKLILNKGDVLAIVGPNGAGKSTLLLTLARLLRPQQGEICFNGIRAQDESDLAYRRRIALVLQDPLLFDMSVAENIAAGLRFRRVNKKEIARSVDIWLERLGIASLKKRRATELSGGEAQRVSLARALALGPDLLLLDEPFSALDPPTRKRLSAELTTLLTETQTTTVLITHDFAEAVQLGQRMGIVLDGALRRVATPQEILHATDDPDIIAFTQQ